MRYILRFDSTREIEVNNFIPSQGDYITVKYLEDYIELNVIRRTFIVDSNICICYCTNVIPF